MKRNEPYADILAQNITNKIKSKILKDTTPTEYEKGDMEASGFTDVYDDIDLQFEKNLAIVDLNILKNLIFYNYNFSFIYFNWFY